MKLYVRAPMINEDLVELNKYFDKVVYDPWNKTGERFYEDEMLMALIKEQPDALITELDQVTEKVLKGYPNLRVIGDCRAIPANIDVNACTKFGVPIICTPARNAQAVAEMLVGLLISYMRNINNSIEWVKDNKWKEGTTPYFTWMGNELSGKSVGFVGFGAVGKAAAKILLAFNCKINYYDPFVNDKFDNYNSCDINEIFEQCDIVSIHLPVLESTKNMINSNLLKKMKKNSIFINTARSAVVDMSALEEIAKNKSIKGIILDVLESEPPTEENLKILKYSNVMLTPHICGATFEVTNHQSRIITERFKEWVNKENLLNIIFNKSLIEDDK